MLADDYLKSTTPISLTEITTLNLKIDPTTASGTDDRFKIVFSTTRGVTSENMPFTKGTF